MTEEDPIHIACLAYLRTVLPDALILHVPNAPRSKQAGARLKRLGMRAGAPDLWVLFEGSLYLFEVKPPKKYASPAQRQFMEDAWDAGAKCAVVRSIADVADALEGFGVKTRAAA